MVKICALQLPTLSMSEARIDHYLRVGAQNGARLVLLGEYVLNSFFTELKVMQKNIIKAQSEHKKELLTRLAKKYNLVIIAPLVVVKNDGFYKVIAKFSPNQVRFCEQNFLMPYLHWNEESFFANTKSDEVSLLTFTIDRVKFGVMSGFEAHFDLCWRYMLSKKVECVLVPNAATFNSNSRWSELLKMRAFTNSLYILRANRIGKAKFDQDGGEDFYGQSMLIAPSGEILDNLNQEEGMLVCEISKKEVTQTRSLWKFQEILSKRNLA